MSVARTNAILETARALWDRQDDIDHDLADGEFYWRHCRWEIVQGLLDATIRDQADRGEPLSVEHYASVASHFHRIQAEDPAVLNWLDHPYPPRMRDAITSWVGSKPLDLSYFAAGTRKDAGSGHWLFVGVRNSRWTGGDLERVCHEMEDRFAQNDTNSAWLAHAREQVRQGQSFVGIDFTFFDAGEFTMRSEWYEIDPDHGLQTRWIPVESPVLMCAIAYPFPPEGVMASIYDAVARGQHRWHKRLYGHAVEDQRIPTSIRTWTIGLLTAVGMRFGEAQRLVEQHLHTTISQPGFNQDREVLVRRVPEATSYLYQRPRRKR